MIEGDPGSSNALNRGKGFKAGVAKHPNLNLVASQTAKWDTNQAQTIATAMLTANPDIKAFYSQNDTMALGVQAAVDAKGLTGKVIIVGTDGIPQAKKKIAEGGSYHRHGQRAADHGRRRWRADGPVAARRQDGARLGRRAGFHRRQGQRGGVPHRHALTRSRRADDGYPTMKPPLLEISNVAKSFPGVRALDDVSFTLRHGEVLTLAGENGAGKSTLLGILGGSLAPDNGSVSVDGVRRDEYSPRQALAEGVMIAHQEPAIVPQLTVEQNLLLGKTAAERRASAAAVDGALADVAAMGFPLDRAALGSRRLSPAQRHALTIAKAFAFGAKIVALDEPTTSMLEHNVAAVLDRVRHLAHERDIGVIFVSHKMPEVMSVSDRVVVLRDGRVGYESPIARHDHRRDRAQHGRSGAAEFPSRPSGPPGRPGACSPRPG